MEFIILSETHLTKNIEESEIKIQGYDQISSLSESSKTGGVIIYYKESWKVDIIVEKIDNLKYWILACRAKCKNNNIIITAVYRSPSYGEAEFCQIFEDTLEEICEDANDVIIAGDFNIDWSIDSFYKKRIERILNDNGLKQIVNEYTRVARNSKTMIDYVITNSHKVSAKNSTKDKISDHEVINIIIQGQHSEPQEKNNSQKEIFKYNKILFQQTLSSIKCDSSKDLDGSVIELDDAFKESVRKCTHVRVLNKKNNVNKWFNEELRQMKTEKIWKYQKAKFENTNEAWDNYRITRNTYKVKLVNENSKYVNNKINNAPNQKQMWIEIKNLVLKKSNEAIKSVIFNQVEIKDNKQIASHFNNYFVKSIGTIRESIENVQYKNIIPMTNNHFKFRAINIAELKNIINELKNKPDYNKISTTIILDNWNLTGKVILNIINKSLQTGVFPKAWKETMVTPIAKVAKTNKCEEFRPINTLKTCEKILEKVVKKQLDKFIEDNAIISKYQSGFRKKYSCETAVNYVINRWKNVEKNNKMMAIFLDFKRAFETIDRQIMLKKLEMYGIKGNELKWFESYLGNRVQITKVNGTTSDEIENGFGVPQGSILGALLFILYINDMPTTLEKCEIVLYADDTLIYTEASTEEQCLENMKHDISKINTWLKMNKLKLNENKTKIMEINMNSDELFKINDEIIEKVEHMSYLGFIIDKDLKFKKHIDYICKKKF